ncbi:hypothetical protein [Bifidobacterium simiarum]|nr:hypothetical protein [Bifidobacterium simiarum]
MKERLTRCAAMLRKYPVAVLVVVTVLLAGFVGLSNYRPVNLYYSVTFTQSPAENSDVTFTFDENKDFASSSIQSAKVTQSQVTIHLDPLNDDSHTLTIAVDGTDAQVGSFVAHTNVRGRFDRVMRSIPGSELQRKVDGDRTVFSLTEAQINDVIKASQRKSETKIGLLMLIGVVFVIILGKLTLFRRLPKRYYAAGWIVLGMVYAFLYRLWIVKQGLGPGLYPYRRAITILLALLLALMAVDYIVGVRGNLLAKRLMCAGSYLAIIGYVVYQFGMYTKYLGGFPDEQAHLSYIAFLSKDHAIIPDFAHMRIYPFAGDNALDFAGATQFNYLGHPPLYYRIMNLLGGLHVAGDQVTFNLGGLRTISFIIGLLGLLVVFYIGLTRIAPIPLLHLLFGIIVIAPVNLVYGLSGLSNDSLLLLTVSIYSLGIIRFFERRYDWKTFLLIAVGVSFTVLTKLTGGMLVVVMSVLVIAYTLIVEHNAKALMRPAFYATTPVYLLPIAYFAGLYAKFHTIQPGYANVAYAEYVTSAMYTPNDKRDGGMLMVDVVQSFIEKFLGTWYAVTGHVPVPRPDMKVYDITTIGVILVFFVPLTVFFFAKSRAQRYLSLAAASVLIVLIYEFIGVAKSYYFNGRFGGYSSRYFLCAIVFFALAILWMISRHLTAGERPVGDRGIARSAGDLTDGPAALVGDVKADDAQPGSIGAKAHAAIARHGAHAAVAPDAAGTGQGSDPDHARLTRLGTAIVLGLILLLFMDGFIYSFLYQADQLPGFHNIPA